MHGSILGTISIYVRTRYMLESCKICFNEAIFIRDATSCIARAIADFLMKGNICRYIQREYNCHNLYESWTSFESDISLNDYIGIRYLQSDWVYHQSRAVSLYASSQKEGYTPSILRLTANATADVFFPCERVDRLSRHGWKYIMYNCQRCG